MVTRANVVNEARSWLGTRWMHQADMKGVGCDCAGLLRGVAIELGVWPRDYFSIPDAATYKGYARRATNNSMLIACEKFMNRIDAGEVRAGDVILMRWSSEPEHVGIIGDYPDGLSLIHCYTKARKVIEHRLDRDWRSRIVAAFMFPGVTD